MIKTHVLLMDSNGNTEVAYTMDMRNVAERRRLGSESLRALQRGSTVITTMDESVADDLEEFLYRRKANG